MALLSIRKVSMGFGGPLLLDQVNLQIEPNERVCLLGRNGAGKSTLMKLIKGDFFPDEGEIVRRQDMKIGLLPQEVPQGLGGTIFEVVARGLGHNGHLLAEYHKISSCQAKENDLSPDDHSSSDRLNYLQQTLEAEGGWWQLQQKIERAISLMELEPEVDFNSLSAGLKRRVLLAGGLACEPDLLLLDEPTNHLDAQSISRMEEFLLRYGGTLLFISHDRMFLRKMATRIIELDRGKLTDWSCTYDDFLTRKQAALETEAEQWALFDKKLAQEETWIRQGIKARRTRNEGRVRALQEMRESRLARRVLSGQVQMQAQENVPSGKLIIEVKGVDYGYGESLLIRDFSTTILRGDRVGIIGPNGSGKTTLLRILLGELTPPKGKIRLGTRLEVSYFDQLRLQLDEEKSVMDNVGGGNDYLTINGKRRHVIGYLEDFLFSPPRAHTPVNSLSGGERNRLLLAKLLARTSNVLVMDEPTNDLDIETLELLEDLLPNYPGTLLLVSHDRTFLNNVVTSTLVLEGDGLVNEYVGGYDDWLLQRKPSSPPAKPEGSYAKAEGSVVRLEKGFKQIERPRKLNFREQRELETLPQQIEKLEAEQRQLYQDMAEPAFYKQESSQIIRAKDRLASLEQELHEAYQRWQALEDLAP